MCAILLRLLPMLCANVFSHFYYALEDVSDFCRQKRGVETKLTFFCKTKQFLKLNLAGGEKTQKLWRGEGNNPCVFLFSLKKNTLT